MKKQIVHQTRGTCSRAIEVNLDENGVIKSVRFLGGCSGNTNGISSLVVGMKAADVIERLKGTRCGMRPTSCPDQLAQALEKALADA
ncbi:MAG: TIGR03905 family TSCPD domain-containing protein [Clostridia bacterium]|nr:TIGR03905 family TSCPD domain-containing protein [Clostridia bacterium]